MSIGETFNVKAGGKMVNPNKFRAGHAVNRTRLTCLKSILGILGPPAQDEGGRLREKSDLIKVLERTRNQRKTEKFFGAEEKSGRKEFLKGTFRSI